MTTSHSASAPRWTALDLAQALGQFPPTPEQRRVIEAPLEPMLVIAGAGSGKTETMAAKVVYLVANGIVAPDQILGLTFTRKAAAELSDRIRQRLRTIASLGTTIDLSAPPRISTYNSYAAAIVADHGLRLGIDPASALISEAGRYQLGEHIVTTWAGDLRLDLAPSTMTRTIIALAGELAEHGLTTDVVRSFLDRTIAEITSKAPAPRLRQPRAEIRGYLTRMAARRDLLDLVDAFAAAKRDRGVVDFADQVRFAADLATRVPAVGRTERATYKVVLLDEYQDTSIAQVQLLTALFGSAHPVTAVGDPNQAIYGWRGAAAGTLLEFPQQFGTAAGPARTATLSTAWRNSRNILTVANKIAAPLRAVGENVPALQPRDGAPSGVVETYFGQTIDDETARIVDHLRQLGWPGAGAPTTAILVRARRMFAPLTRALVAAGIPHHVSGLGGLLSTPEVADLWAALTVVHDPTRSDALMRLLTGPTMRIGPRDLFVLSAWARELARNRAPEQRTTPPPQENAAPPPQEDVETAATIEAVEYLPPTHYAPGGRGHRLSADARERLGRLAQQLRTIRSFAHLPVPDLLALTEQTLGLDIAVIAHRKAGTERENLDAFAAVASSFVSGIDGSNLGGFLSWLEAAAEHERGLDGAETEPEAGVVHLMTIHAAKGLEWEAVVVAGMGEGIFPAHAPNKDGHRRAKGWLTDISLLPYDLRGDATNLPSFDHAQADTHAEMKDVAERFQLEEGARMLQEERRLAYVALTRAKDDLLLTGSFWTHGRAGAIEPSLFLTEATRAGVETTPVPTTPDASENPLGEEATPALWPPPSQPMDLSPAPAPGPASVGEDDTIAQWYRLARLLLAERDAEARQENTTVDHLPASRVVAAARDARQFEFNLRRPIPQEPSHRARRGTEFHTWIEQHFNSPALIDWDQLDGEHLDGEETVAEEDLAELRATFLASPWAARTPVALEAGVETTIAGIRIRSRIDAIFRDDDGAYHVVDWKTGRAGAAPAEEEARMAQLHVYRLAWARARQIDVENVRASFYYVGEDLTVAAPALTEEEIIATVSTHLQGVARH